MKVFITREIPSVAIKLLQKEKIYVEVYKKDKPIPRKDLLKGVSDVDGVISLLTDPVDKEIIDSMKKCKVIANYAAGYNNIDFLYAKEKGIVVTNTPDVLTDSTADIAMLLILNCARRINEAIKYLSDDKFTGWKPLLLLGYELKGKQLGIIGAGRIGKATALRAKAFGMKILYYNRSRNEHLERETGAKKVSLKTIMKEADIVSVHIPFNSKTNKLIDKKMLQLMKPTGILINTARGEVIDEKFLISMLKKKKIFAAGFDVYENEPFINPELKKLKNVVLLPHIGSATFESRGKMAELAAKNVIAVLKGKKTLTPV